MKSLFATLLALAVINASAEAPTATPNDQFFWSDPNPPGAIDHFTIYAVLNGTVLVSMQTVKGTNAIDCLTLLTNQPAGNYVIYGSATSTNGVSGPTGENFGVKWTPVVLPPPEPISQPPTGITLQKKTPPGLSKKGKK